MSEKHIGAEPAPVEEIRLGGINLRFLIDGPSSGRPLSMFEMFVEPGAKVPLPHHHEGFDETVYGLSGVLRMTLDGKTFDLGAGDSLYIPRGAVHGFENPTAETAKALMVITPGVFWSTVFPGDCSTDGGRRATGTEGIRGGDAPIWADSGAGMRYSTDLSTMIQISNDILAISPKYLLEQ